VDSKNKSGKKNLDTLISNLASVSCLWLYVVFQGHFLLNLSGWKVRGWQWG